VVAPVQSGQLIRAVRIILAALCLLGAGGIVLAAGLPDRGDALNLSRSGQTPIAAEVGALAPPLEVYDVHGQAFSLAALRGHVVVVNFWATWCGPCVTEMPILQAMYERHQAEGVRFVGVDVGEPTADVLDWIQRFKLTYDFVVDGEGRLTYLYMIRGMPSTFIIGPDGTVREVISGPINAESFEAELKALQQKS
jgi:thiol-disulfide isomerase/thioredoxin